MNLKEIMTLFVNLKPKVADKLSKYDIKRILKISYFYIRDHSWLSHLD